MELDAVFADGKTSFIGDNGLRPEDDASAEVRYSAKVWPRDTCVPHPPVLAGFKKATLVLISGREHSAMLEDCVDCPLYKSPRPRDRQKSRMPSSH